jgi:heavy metal translocating P-type ATPase
MFRETELFRKCQEMGIIPRSESELKTLSQKNSVPPKRNDDASVPGIDTGTVSVNKGLSLTLKVTDMWCPACTWVIEEGLRKSPGIFTASGNFSTDTLRCEYDPLKTSPLAIIESVEKLGYSARLLSENGDSKERKREFIRLAISAFLSVNVMMLSFALYSGFFIELSGDAIVKLSWPIFIMASVVVFYGGQKIHGRAWAGVTTAAFGMESLISIGVLSAYLYSTINFFLGSIHLYYDTASMLVTLFLFGKTIEGSTKQGIQEDLESFSSLMPGKVRICSARYPDGRYVSADYLQHNDIFRVEEGESLPADGVIMAGSGAVDEAAITGEPRPFSKIPGDWVKSGSRVVHGSFNVRAEKVGGDSIIGQMLQIMERALNQKTPLEGKTDTVLKWFVPLILILSVGTGLTCLVFGLSGEAAMVRAITVMVISCPCALGIAIPLTRVVGIAGAAKKGILVRDFSSFEQVEKMNTYVFDKTGTITEGTWKLLSIIPANGYAKEDIMAMASGLEQGSEHYIAREIKKRADDLRVKPAVIEQVKVHENGITGIMGRDEVKIGSRDFLTKELRASEEVPEYSDSDEEIIVSRVYMSLGGVLCGIFIFGDTLRAGAKATVEQLRKLGYTLALVSGDGNKTTREVGQAIGIGDAHGTLLPQDKAAYVANRQDNGLRIAMVGDGINDAPALIQSDLGIAVHSQNPLGKEAAAVILMRGELRQILDFRKLASRVNRKVHQNLFVSFFYNFVSIPIAMSGLLTPLVAVCAMFLSSLSVIGNTALLNKKLQEPFRQKGN